MSIQDFNVKEQWIGDGTLAAYTFDFTIQDLAHLLVIQQDDQGRQMQKVRGDDTSFLSGVVFDAVNGGGTVTLQANLADQWTITFLMANDVPIQPTQFQNKLSFTLRGFELALDYIVCQIQRLAYLSNRSMKLDDLDDMDSFDPTLPPFILNNAGATIIVSETGNGFDYGATLGEIAAAITYATAAQTAQAAAQTAQAAAAASAAAAAASAGQAASGWVPYGTRDIPLLVTAAGGITPHGNQSEFQYIHGSPGAVIVTANPQIAAGTAHGQLLRLIGRDNTNTVKFTNGNGLSLNGDFLMGEDDIIEFFWDTFNWVETLRRSAT